MIDTNLFASSSHGLQNGRGISIFRIFPVVSIVNVTYAFPSPHESMHDRSILFLINKYKLSSPPGYLGYLSGVGYPSNLFISLLSSPTISSKVWAFAHTTT